jgi:hypothetical protein
MKPLVDDRRSHPWYMESGEKRPVAASRAKSGRRLAQLWPDEKPGSDRIADQLMFVPPKGIIYNPLIKFFSLFF